MDVYILNIITNSGASERELLCAQAKTSKSVNSYYHEIDLDVGDYVWPNVKDYFI